MPACGMFTSGHEVPFPRSTFPNSREVSLRHRWGMNELRTRHGLLGVLLKGDLRHGESGHRERWNRLNRSTGFLETNFTVKALVLDGCTVGLAQAPIRLHRRPFELSCWTFINHPEPHRPYAEFLYPSRNHFSSAFGLEASVSAGYLILHHIIR